MRPVGLVTDRIWCWADLGAEIRRRRDDGPTALSAAGARAALATAIAREAPKHEAVAAVADRAGFRRRLAARIAAWTRAGRRPGGRPPRDRPIDLVEWRIYARYREHLKTIESEDDDGLALWAARVLRDDPPADLRQPGPLTVIDPPPAGGLVARLVLDYAMQRPGPVRLTIPIDEAAAEAFAESIALRDRLVTRGFVVEAVGPVEGRPATLRAIEAGLAAEAPTGGIEAGPGFRRRQLRLRGAPRGDEQARQVADEVARGLRCGLAAEEILVLVRSWDDEADRLVEGLRALGIAAAGAGPGRPLREDAGVRALRLAAALAGEEDWEADGLARLLRNGRLRPSWAGPETDLAAAAASVRESRVYRGLEPLRKAIGRLADPGDAGDAADREARRRRAERAAAGLEAIEGLSAMVGSCCRSGRWRAQAAGLRRLAGGLGLDGPVVAELLGAVDDHGAVMEGLRLGGEPRGWAEFARQVEAIGRELRRSPEPTEAGAVRVLPVDEAAGARARLVVVANLVEGSFPSRDALRPGAEGIAEVDRREAEPEEGSAANPPPPRRRRGRAPAEGQGTLALGAAEVGPEPSAFGREAWRFLRAVGSADDRLSLVYPTVDPTGQELRPAGFVEDVRALLSDGLRSRVERSRRGLDPALLSAWRVSTAERRVRAVARGGPIELARLAADPTHREALAGAAIAMEVGASRSGGRPYGRHEGRLRDRRAIEALAGRFGPAHAYSASQLESLAFCPFQFFQRYVLRLEPVDDRDELEDDRAMRGSLVHAALEKLHVILRDDPTPAGEDEAARVAARIGPVIAAELAGREPPGPGVAAGLRAIEAGRLARLAGRYADQFRTYADGPGRGARAAHLELTFGDPREADRPPLELGDGESAIRVRGMIDRVDLAGDGGSLRVIDYKTGPTPRGDGLRDGTALQLPLYLLAASRMLGASGGQAGYWALGGEGYRRGVDDGSLDESALVEFVAALVDRLRGGDLPVHPRKRVDCERRCDYRTVCRIAQARSARKPWPEQPDYRGDRR